MPRVSFKFRPNNVLAFALSIWLGVIGFDCLLLGYGSFDEPARELVNARLRISWGGGSARSWQGAVHFHDAEISHPTVLGVNVESPAGIVVRNHAVRIKQLSDSTFEGIDLDVFGYAESRISFELATKGNEPIRQELSLHEIFERPQVFLLDESRNRISFERVRGDQVRVVTKRRHMLFDPGETFEFHIQANRVRDGSENTKCHIETIHADTQQVVARTTISLPCAQLGTSALVKQLMAVPQTEGVYEVRFSLENDNTNELIPKRKQLASRAIQLVVIGDRPFPQDNSPWLPVLELGPKDLDSMLSKSVNQLTRLVGVGGRSGAIGNFQVKDAPIPEVVLPVGGWQAVALNIADPQSKHLIELDYDSSGPMALGLSLLVEGQDGEVSNFGFDSGVVVEKCGAGGARANESVHQFAFWPDAKQVVLLIANRDSKNEAKFRRIRLLRRQPGNQLEAKPVAEADPGSRAAKRGMMVFYEQPLFAENFGVDRSQDEVTQQPISDWSTFYQGTKRLISHLREIGASGAFINVLGEGSTLSPLKTTSSSPRYDSGVFSTKILDPMKKDVVELLYRVFEREQMQLIPMLTFDHPLASVELQNAEDAKLVDYRGNQPIADEYELPPYNPLSPTVRPAINSIIEEFVNRYSERVGYRGVGIVCRPDTCMLLPGSRIAGYDTKSIEEFQKKSSLPGPPLDGNQLLSPSYSRTWLDWRLEKMEEWFAQISQMVTRGRREARCYLALIDITRNEEFSSILAPALHHSPDIGQAMARMGISNELPTQRSKLVLMWPHRYAPLHPLSSQKSDFELQDNSQFATWFGEQPETASLFYSRSAWARFENLEQSSMIGRNPIMRLQQLSRANRWGCHPLAKSLLNSDAAMFIDGGLLLSASLNKYRKEFLTVYSQLSKQKFDEVKHLTHPNERHPVAVRYLNTEFGTEIYLVNACPWPIEVTLKVNDTPNALASFGPGDPFLQNNSASEIRVAMQPFELVAGRTTEARLKPKGFSYQLPEQAQRELNASYYKLRSKLIASGNCRPLNWLENPGFEKSFENWTTESRMSDLVSVRSGSERIEGNSALHLQNPTNQYVWVRSDALPVPETGRLSISVWLKLGKDQKQPPLRISVESVDRACNYYRFAEVGSLNAEQNGNQLTSNWRQFAVHFDDIPEKPVRELRIGFDLIGPGEVWIDHVQIYDRWLDENDSKAVTQMLASIGPLLNQDESFERCRRILNSYWPTFLRRYIHEEDEEPGSFAGNGEKSQNRNSSESQNQPARSSMRQRFRKFVSPGIFQFR